MNSQRTTTQSSQRAVDGEGVVASADQLPAIVIVGIHGYGASHVRAVDALVRAGTVRLVGLVDRTITSDDRAIGVPVFGDLEACLAVSQVDLVILSTPIHTHLELAIIALEHGADVLLEKPPVTSNAEFDLLQETADRTGRLVQVGFQSLGSLALPAIEQTIADGAIGEVVALHATGHWARTTGYWTRAAWSGKRTLDGVPVVDGVITNPLAHAVQTMLCLGHATERSAISRIELDQYRANDIEADDTSVVRITPTDGPTMTAALTLCAEEQLEPFVTVRGTNGTIRFGYTTDTVELTTTDPAIPAVRTEYGRVGLIDDVLAARAALDDGLPTRLLSPLSAAAGFTAVLDAVRSAPAPQLIDDTHLVWRGTGAERRPVLDGIGDLLERAASTGSTFAELRAPWARG